MAEKFSGPSKERLPSGPSDRTDAQLKQIASREEKVLFARMNGYLIEVRKNKSTGRLDVEISRDGAVVDRFDCSRENGPRILGVSEAEIASGLREPHLDEEFRKAAREYLNSGGNESGVWKKELAGRADLQGLMARLERAKDLDDLRLQIDDWNRTEESRRPPEGLIMKLSEVKSVEVGGEHVRIKAYYRAQSGTLTLGWSRER